MGFYLLPKFSLPSAFVYLKEIRKVAAEKQGGTTMTVRHVESMVRIAEANARMELRTNVTKKDIDYAPFAPEQKCEKENVLETTAA